MSTEAQDQLRARKVEAFLRERDFVDQLNRLAEVWTKFVNEYNQKHAINVKLARDLSKAFRDVEKENGWPNVRVKNRKFVFLHKAAEPDHSCE